jgi:hypothetical protein
MPKQKKIDFERVDWDQIDREKAEFFRGEAVIFNNKVIEDINTLNDKIFKLLAFAFSVLSAATWFLISVWERQNSENVVAASICACACMFVVIVLLSAGIFPREIYRGEGSPLAYFSDDYYIRDMRAICAGSIIKLDKYINHNQNLMEHRGLFLRAGIIAFMLAPVFTLAFFFLYPRS